MEIDISEFSLDVLSYLFEIEKLLNFNNSIFFSFFSLLHNVAVSDTLLNNNHQRKCENFNLKLNALMRCKNIAMLMKTGEKKHQH